MTYLDVLCYASSLIHDRIINTLYVPGVGSVQSSSILPSPSSSIRQNNSKKEILAITVQPVFSDKKIFSNI